MSLHTLRRQLSQDRSHFSPFFVLGDPTPELSLQLIDAAVGEGVTMLELGFPYDDPVADGPAIQTASRRARRAGVSTGQALDLLSEVARRHPQVALNLLLYGNLIHAAGEVPMLSRLREAGASSLLVADICIEEDEHFAARCSDEGLGYVTLVGPQSRGRRLDALIDRASAFIYLVGWQGTTGVRSGLSPGLAERIRDLSSAHPTPICIGFGLSQARHLREVFRAGASIAIVGSAIANCIASHTQPNRQTNALVPAVTELIRALGSAGSSGSTDSMEEERCSS